MNADNGTGRPFFSGSCSKDSSEHYIHIDLIIVIFSVLLKVYVLCLPSYGRGEAYQNKPIAPHCL